MHEIPMNLSRDERLKELERLVSGRVGLWDLLGRRLRRCENVGSTSMWWIQDDD